MLYSRMVGSYSWLSTPAAWLNSSVHVALGLRYMHSSLKAAQAALKKILDKYPKIHRAEVIIL